MSSRVSLTVVELPTIREAADPRGRQLLLMAFSTLGAVYGDIGTSPIYALQGIFPADAGTPKEEDVIGAISAILWSITLIALIKYAIFATAFASKEGEGGCFSLFTSWDPVGRRRTDEDDFAAVPGLAIFRDDRRKSGQTLRRPFVKWLLLILSLLGTSLTLADGTLTPPISVTSAVEGLALEAPSLVGKTYGIAIVVLFFIFCAQRFGTHRISFVFAPCVACWCLLLFSSGIANVTYHPGIWRAFDISRAVAWFARTRDFFSLASVALSITGCEAMFAGLGHFSAGAMRLAFLTVVYPALCLQYLGQGARLINDGDFVVQNIFFNSLKLLSPGLYWFGWISSILAVVIASQALITASFSLYQQLLSFSCAPSLKVTHTSDHPGQVYISKVNWLLCAVCLALTGGFQTSTRLSHAYVLSTVGVMLISTMLMAISIVAIKKLHWTVALLFFVPFGFIEGCFFGAATSHIADGAWYTLSIALVLCAFLCCWFWHANLELTYDTVQRRPLKLLVSPYSTIAEEVDAKRARKSVDVHWETTLSRVPSRDSSPERGHSRSTEKVQMEPLDSPVDTKTPVTRVSTVSSFSELAEEDGEDKIADVGLQELYLVPHPLRILLSRPPVFALFHTTSSILSRGAPPSLTGFLQRYPALPSVTVLFMIRILPIPHVEASNRIMLAKYDYQGLYECCARFGFRDEVDLTRIHEDIGRKLLQLESRAMHSDPAGARLRKEAIIEAAKAASIHVLPTYHLRGRPVLARVPLVGPLISVIRDKVLQTFNKLAALTPTSDGYTLDEETVMRIGIVAET